MGMYFVKSLGIIGLLFITAGVFNKGKREDFLFVIGGIFLLLYSMFRHDPVFIALQTVFIVASAYEMYKKKR